MSWQLAAGARRQWDQPACRAQKHAAQKGQGCAQKMLSVPASAEDCSLAASLAPLCPSAAPIPAHPCRRARSAARSAGLRAWRPAVQPLSLPEGDGISNLSNQQQHP